MLCSDEKLGGQRHGIQCSELIGILPLAQPQVVSA